MMHPK